MTRRMRILRMAAILVAAILVPWLPVLLDRAAENPAFPSSPTVSGATAP